MAIFGEFFVSCIFSEPCAARFRPEMRFALFCYELLALANLDF